MIFYRANPNVPALPVLITLFSTHGYILTVLSLYVAVIYMSRQQAYPTVGEGFLPWSCVKSWCIELRNMSELVCITAFGQPLRKNRQIARPSACLMTHRLLIYHWGLALFLLNCRPLEFPQWILASNAKYFKELVGRQLLNHKNQYLHTFQDI